AEEAQDILNRIELGVSFAEMARRRSLDMTTRSEGGDLGKVRLSSLPESIAAVVADLPVGEVSDPVEGAEGWYLLAVEGRSAVRLPPYAELRSSLERRLRDKVVAETIAEARAAVPIRMAGNGIEAGSPAQIMALQASAGGTW
ncbi:MAG: peptidylprolyl isomerase, partial [Pseudomonadota bacterium]